MIDSSSLRDVDVHGRAWKDTGERDRDTLLVASC